ncbi:protein of unknown function [Taphrina deformans PYCC 5710]|uniref:Thioredoxin domain-containing protein n=1 Tax=Taphrina deformans (strain PYCC 5710 / ATCC 11124 / CBS 356.35 / IMI 108563 / JCM 9778 / NBRC 8474) TaxID=1097556 RepID=R4XF06_TAPDE|nr:protein of unknown function [Taphrina deformans PYCC 5710]|eukprot:CCG84218.1 protein of unknown function [Taphrina deformans PYCC 5710]
MRWSLYLSLISVALSAAIDATQNDAGTPVSVIPSLTTANFDTTVAKGKWFVKFFSPHCGHCIALAPHWEKAGTKYEALAETHNFHLASVDCTVNGDLCNAHGVQGYPTLLLFDKGTKIDEYLNIASDDPLKPLSDFIEKHSPKSFPDEPIDESHSHKPKKPELRQTKVDKSSDKPGFVKKPPIASSTADTVLGSIKTTAKDTAQGVAKGATGAAASVQDGLKSAADDVVKAARPLLTTDFKQTSEKTFSAINPTGTSINLTPETFTKLVTNTQDGWFIKFYAPWCGHCKAMAPAWNELAHDSQNKLNIGEVNCEAESRLCSDIKIHGYPTLLYFQGETHVEYTGLRGLGDLMAFAQKTAAASIKDVDAAAFEAIEKKEEVIFLYFYDTATTTEDFEALQKTSLELIGYAPLLKTSSTILASRFRATVFPKLMVIRDGKPQYYNALGPADMRDHKKILAWMKSAWLPVVPELSAENSHEIMENRIVVLSILDPNHPDFEQHRATMKDSAHDYIDQRASEEQAEKQNLRDIKQSKIDDATKKGDTKAIQSAKDIRVKVSNHQEVGFAWVNGIFWEKWLAAAYAIDVNTDGPRVIINDENSKRYWDTDTKGRPIAFTKAAILETIGIVTTSPSKLTSKSTKNTLEAAYYAARQAGTGHPIILGCFGIGALAAVLLVLTRGKRKHGISLGGPDRLPFASTGNGKFD